MALKFQARSTQLDAHSTGLFKQHALFKSSLLRVAADYLEAHYGPV